MNVKLLEDHILESSDAAVQQKQAANDCLQLVQDMKNFGKRKATADKNRNQQQLALMNSSNQQLCSHSLLTPSLPIVQQR